MSERICSVDGCDELAWGRKRRCQVHHEAAQPRCFVDGCGESAAPGKHRCQAHHYEDTSFCIDGEWAPDGTYLRCGDLAVIQYRCQVHHDAFELEAAERNERDERYEAELRGQTNPDALDALIAEIERVAHEYMCRATDDDALERASVNLRDQKLRLNRTTIAAAKVAVEPLRYAQFDTDTEGYGAQHLELAGRTLALYDRAGEPDPWVLLHGIPNHSVHQVPDRVVKQWTGDKIVTAWNEFFREKPPCLTGRWVVRASGDDPLGILRAHRCRPLIQIGGLDPIGARFHMTYSTVGDNDGRTMSLTDLAAVVAYLETHYLARLDPWAAAADPLIMAAARAQLESPGDP